MVENNKAIRSASTGGQPLHINGSATATPATQTFTFSGETVKSTQVYVQNTGANELQISLDGTANYWSIANGTSQKFEVETTAITHVSSLGTDFELVVTF